jgi:hypothetical protein
MPKNTLEDEYQVSLYYIERDTSIRQYEKSACGHIQYELTKLYCNEKNSKLTHNELPEFVEVV